MIVKEIKIIKDRVKIKCDDNSITDISLDTYLNNHILLNEEITKEELASLLSKDEIDVIRNQLIKKLMKKRLSIYECREYLSSCNLNDEIVSRIIKELTNNYLINDKELAESIIMLSLVNKKGVNKIKDTLFSRNVSGDYNQYIQEFLDREKYNANIVYLVDKYNKLGKNKSGKVLEDYIRIHLLNNGFTKEEIEPFIKINPKDDSLIVKETILKYFHNRELNEKNIAKITKKLVSKGFNYDIIKITIRECVKNETD